MRDLRAEAYVGTILSILPLVGKNHRESVTEPDLEGSNLEKGTTLEYLYNSYLYFGSLKMLEIIQTVEPTS